MTTGRRGVNGLLVQAQDFFNAFEVLHESNQRFILSSLNSSNNPPQANKYGTLPSMGVDVVCLAFSVELFIKYLHLAITGRVPHEHSIMELYKKLPKNVQQEIFACRSIANYGWSYSQFEKELFAISDGFTKWRYSYEANTLRYNSYFALAFIEAMKNAAPVPDC
jgi:hypothetical protein